MMKSVEKVVGIADGDDEWLDKLRKAIDRLGYPVLAAQNGKDLLIPFRDGELSVLICDTHLKDMSGVELISTIRETDPDLPIVATTRDYSKNLELACRKMGIVFYARKPLNFEVIRWIVRRNMARSAHEDTFATEAVERN